MKRKKVLHITFGGLGNGGVSAVVMSIVRPLNEDYDFSILSYWPAEKVRLHECEKLGVNVIDVLSLDVARIFKIIPIIEPLLRPFIIFFTCLSLCIKERYDIVHCHDASESAWYILAAKIVGAKKRIMHSHNSKSPQKRGNLFILFYRTVVSKIGLCTANDYLGCSVEACEAMFGSKYHYTVINNAIKLDSFLETSKVESKGKLRFIHVGRMTYPKNQSFVLEVFNEIHEQNANTQLTFIGEGSDLLDIKEQCKNYSLEDCVSFLPANTNVPEAFANADCMIFSSFYEGFGIVLLEAQASGVYCFASSVVPKTTDIGLCDYISLDKDAKYWAQHILNKANRLSEMKIDMDKLKAYDETVIASKYKTIYG